MGSSIGDISVTISKNAPAIWLSKSIQWSIPPAPACVTDPGPTAGYQNRFAFQTTGGSQRAAHLLTSNMALIGSSPHQCESTHAEAGM